MRLQTQVILSLGLLWIAFLGFVYVGAHDYLLASLLQIESKENQEILINQYAFSQVIKHYLTVFIFLGLVFGVLAWYLLRGVFIKHSDTLQSLHHTMAEEVKREGELHQKIAVLEKRSEKADRVDGIFHDLCDHLNNVGTSLALVKEQVENSNNESVMKELTSLDHHLAEVNRIIKSI